MVRLILENSAGFRWGSKNLAQSCVLGITVGAVLSSSANAQSYDSNVAQQEITKRSESVLLAQELLFNGDSHYSKGEYEEAVSVYSQAFTLIPNGGLSKELKGAASERYAQAAVEYSRSLSRFGQYDEARTVLKNVLSPSVAKGHVGATQMLAQLDDPIRTNPVLTAQLSRDAESAGQWLRKAEGYFNLGKFDDAVLAYEEVLHLDPYNTAARRGMERVAGAKSQYAGAAYDQARAQALMQVDSQWELKVNPSIGNLKTSEPSVLEEERIQEVYANKLRHILVPIVDLQDVPISEAYDMIRIWSKEYDTSSVDQSNKGVNFVLNIGSANSDWGNIIRKKRVTLNLRHVPLTTVLDLVSKATGTQWHYEDHAVVVTPSGSADSTIHRRTFRVPPTFMQDAANQASDNDDPFAQDSGSKGALGARVSAKAFLKQLGVTFPEGAAAKYVPGTGSLMVANTLQNIDLIEQYVRNYSQTENVQVVMKLTIIDVARSDLDELSFDLLFGTSSGKAFVSGGTQGNGRDVTSDISGAIGNASPVTSGLRSGDSMFDKGSLQDSVQTGANSSSLSQRSKSAPGILSLRNEDVLLLMRGLSQKKNVERVEMPSVIARSGEKATLFNGREITYPTEFEPAQLPNFVGGTGSGTFPVTPSTPTAFETRLVGVSLEVEATISEDKNYVDVRIESDITNFDGFVNYGSPIQFSEEGVVGEITPNAILVPIFRAIPLNTAVTVQDGSTFVIAGLNQSSIESVEDKVPLLGDLPLVGRFFKSEGIRKTDRALLIFVNVELKDPTGKNWRER